jgi:hypothetical protein
MLKTIFHVDGETINSPSQKDKDETPSLEINSVLYRAPHKCVLNPGSVWHQKAPELFVQCDR